MWPNNNKRTIIFLCLAFSCVSLFLWFMNINYDSFMDSSDGMISPVPEHLVNNLLDKTTVTVQHDSDIHNSEKIPLEQFLVNIHTLSQSPNWREIVFELPKSMHSAGKPKKSVVIGAVNRILSELNNAPFPLTKKIKMIVHTAMLNGDSEQSDDKDEYINEGYLRIPHTLYTFNTGLQFELEMSYASIDGYKTWSVTLPASLFQYMDSPGFIIDYDEEKRQISFNLPDGIKRDGWLSRGDYIYLKINEYKYNQEMAYLRLIGDTDGTNDVIKNSFVKLNNQTLYAGLLGTGTYRIEEESSKNNYADFVRNRELHLAKNDTDTVTRGEFIISLAKIVYPSDIAERFDKQDMQKQWESLLADFKDASYFGLSEDERFYLVALYRDKLFVGYEEDKTRKIKLHQPISRAEAFTLLDYFQRIYLFTSLNTSYAFDGNYSVDYQTAVTQIESAPAFARESITRLINTDSFIFRNGNVAPNELLRYSEYCKIIYLLITEGSVYE